VVTGAGGALGRAVVSEFAATGVRVIAVARSVKTVAPLVDAHPDAVAAEAADLTDPGAVTALWQRVDERGAVARFLVNMTRRFASMDVTIESAVVNGEPGVVVTLAGSRVVTLTAHVDDGAIAALYSVVNPDKLAALDIADPMI